MTRQTQTVFLPTVQLVLPGTITNGHEMLDLLNDLLTEGGIYEGNLLDWSLASESGEHLAVERVEIPVDYDRDEDPFPGSDTNFQTAMALWEAVLDCFNGGANMMLDPFVDEIRQRLDDGFTEMRLAVCPLVPLAKQAYAIVEKTYTQPWDWHFIPSVVRAWAEAGYSTVNLTAEGIAKRAMELMDFDPEGGAA